MTKKKKSDVILKVPEGDWCCGCMFLSIDYLHNLPECVLFNEKLLVNFKYGGMEESSIRKSYKCPKNNS